MRLIDADALWKAITIRIEEYADIADIMEIIEMQPIIEERETERWIPCSERLPEEDENVLVTDEDYYVDIARYSYNAWCEDPIIEWWNGEYRIFPIAWMPLPKPYEGSK